jgi:hypothetical protein
MPQLDIAVQHGQTAETAGENFERAIDAAWYRYGRWVRQLEWTPDRTAVNVSGAGFDMRLSYDHRKVYARHDPDRVQAARGADPGAHRVGIKVSRTRGRDLARRHRLACGRTGDFLISV